MSSTMNEALKKAGVTTSGNNNSTAPKNNNKKGKKNKAKNAGNANQKKVGRPQITNRVVTGKIKWIDVRKGYGFIVDDETGKDIFVAVRSINNPKIFYGLDPDDTVTFRVGRDENGRNVAMDVTQIEIPAVKEAKETKAEPQKTAEEAEKAEATVAEEAVAEAEEESEESPAEATGDVITE